MYVVGQTKNKELIDGGKLDNATFILIKGPRNYGKTYLTKYIANHYKMNYLLLDNKVDTIRQLVSSSDKNNNCLYHFKDFDKASPAAKAALLKIAEETPNGVKIVVTTSAYNFLDTLMSRAYILNIAPYSFEEIYEYSKALFLSNEFMEKLNKTYKDITPSMLYKLKEMENADEILDLARKTIEAMNRGLKLEDISEISSKFWKDDKTAVELYLDILANSGDKLHKNCFKMVHTIEATKFILNKVAINNYRNLIHNMLMEMV